MSDLILEKRTAGQTESRTARSRSKRSFVVFIGVWIVIIGCGLFGAKLYTDRIQQNLTAQLERQTSAQITAMQQTYDARLEQMETSYAADLAELTSKVDALNELLNFTKDNADSKTDNSNKLYTQLNEVKKQLAELKKNLDVLK
jgi:multidrug efflux pump subunit AcrA (membrane-fusion protein)